ncbi:MAG: type VI secretion system lipoprotein TssJ [Janthinobacterium lividum]|jgi:type VI secretion system protein VasD
MAASIALLLAGCAKNGQTPPSADAPEKAADAATVELHFNAVAGLNPGANGQPAPVRVRIFELKNTASFLRADYFALAERAQATLGADLIDQDEVLVQPGQQLTLSRDLNSTTRQIGLVVGYREIDQAQWRTVVTVAPRKVGAFQIGLDARAVTSAPAATPTRPAQ